MSKPITLHRLAIEQAESGALPTKYTLYLSDGTTTEALGAFDDTPEQMAVTVANKLLDINTPTYEHAVTPAHARLLIKFSKAIKAKGLNSVHRREDMDRFDLSLTKDEEANLTYLRYHALLVMDDYAPAGYWLITKRGWDWLRGDRTIPKHSLVKSNERIGENGPEIALGDLLKSPTEWPTKESLFMHHEPREAVQGALAL